MNSLVRVISTGGTIDSSPDYDPDEKSSFHGTYIPQALAEARLSGEVVLEQLMQKDSLDINAEDRELIRKRCIASPEERIVITHGTATMSDTARLLGKSDIGNKTVVLVGSFTPLSQPGSDALFNLGYAVASAQLLPAGVWVAISGEVFEWDNVRKNKEKGRFERIR